SLVFPDVIVHQTGAVRDVVVFTVFHPFGGKDRLMANRSRIVIYLSIVGWLSAMLTGCSLSNPTDNPFTTSMSAPNGKPTVWACTVVQMSSPPRYACSDNKTYTAFQLRD